ncbi:MAG TPA: hypothetical protein VK890_11025, partial [Bacteroidia bacterium]|nr:hypothetical protein [Bacteroidia bacterium]
MKRTICVLVLLFFSSFLTSGQNKGAGVKWTSKNIFDQNVFIENNGQFPAAEQAAIGQKIFYSTFKGKLHIYFLATGIAFRYDSIYVEDKQDEEPGIGEEKDNIEKRTKVKHVFSNLEWAGANTSATIEVQDEANDYYTYGNPTDGHSGIICHAWKKLIYRNLYKGIDVELYYPQDKGGIEYSIIVHPGADPSVVKMQYSAGNRLVLSGNELYISSPVANFIDHAPNGSTNGSTNVPVSFLLNNNTVSFSIQNYDKSKTLVIDPWVTSPGLGGNNRAYDVDCDVSNNSYAYGGEYPYQIVKLSSTGAKIWTYTSTMAYTFSTNFSFYGDIAVDGLSGTSFIGEGYDGVGGAQMLRINTAGVQTGTYTQVANFNEIWKMEFNNCLRQGVVIGGGTSSPNFTACLIDTNMVSMPPVRAVDTPRIDLSMLNINNSGACYIVPSASGGGKDALVKTTIASLGTPLYANWTPMLTPVELSSVYYIFASGSSFAGGNGFNGLASTSTNVYTYDGSLLAKWNAATGAPITNKIISTPFYKSGGLVADECGNIFVGNGKNVYQYDSTFKKLNTFALKDTVYCLKLSNNGFLFASGLGFVSLIYSPKLTTTFTPPSCTCN